MKNLELSDDEAQALVRLLRRAIDEDHFPLSPRVLTWLGILGKLTLKPEPARPAVSPEPRVYERPSRGRYRTRR
jgi:hypothetical protein